MVGEAKKIEKLHDSLKRVLNLLDVRIESLAKDIKQLDQDKVYYINVGNKTPEDIEKIREIFYLAFDKLDWTPPRIVFGTEELKEVEK